MSKERPAYLPELPEVYPRTNYVPAEPPAPAGEARPSPIVITTAELRAMLGHPPPVDAGPQDSGTVEPPAPTGEAAPAPEVKEQARVQLAGRVGQHPTLRTTPKGTLVARFPLGVKDETDLEKTTWHTVLAFRERAEQVRDRLKKGDPVEVIGYRHERQIPRRDGTTRTVHEVYATAVKPR